MANSDKVSRFTRTIAIINEIQRIGFPTKQNIHALEILILSLQDLAPQFKRPVFRASIDELTSTIKKIKARLLKEGDIPSRQYTRFNAELVVFKENLISDLALSEPPPKKKAS